MAAAKGYFCTELGFVQLDDDQDLVCPRCGEAVARINGTG